MSTHATKRALVTGATGFIGSHLLAHLHRGGWQTSVIARPNAAKALAGNPHIHAIHPFTGETQQLIDAVAATKPDTVFHLASLFLATHTPQQVEPLITSNILFGAQLLEAMKLANATALINAGTSWQAYITTPDDPGTAYNPVNLYAATKQAFEDLLPFYVQTASLRVITLRLYDSYGPGDTRRKLLRLLLDALKSGEPLGMSPGDQVLDLVYVDDICRAFLHAANLVLAQPQPAAHVYAISGNQRRTLREVAATLEAASGQTLPITFGLRPHRDREVMHPSSGVPLPGWQPRITLLEGFKHLLAEEASPKNPS